MDHLKPRLIPMNRRRRIYEGKAKVLYEGPEPGTLIQHFKDDATAFNAKKHEVIDGKGVLNNRISEFIFQNLNDIGVPTHFIRRLNMREQLIREVEIVPLEVVVRNVAAGSLSTRLGLEEGTHRVGQLDPWRIGFPDVEASDAREWPRRPPLTEPDSRPTFGVVPQCAALFANVGRSLRPMLAAFRLVPSDLLPAQDLPAFAVRARHEKPTLVRLRELGLDPADAADGGDRGAVQLRVRHRGGVGRRQA